MQMQTTITIFQKKIEANRGLINDDKTKHNNQRRVPGNPGKDTGNFG